MKNKKLMSKNKMNVVEFGGIFNEKTAKEIDKAERSMSLKGQNHLMLQQIDKNGKRVWRMTWHDTMIPKSHFENITDAVDEAIRKENKRNT